MEKKIIATAAFLGVIAVVMGAFGAHGLKAVLSESQLISFETAVKYQMYHALFLLFVGTTMLLTADVKKLIFGLAIVGIVFFSGSIYLLSTTSLTGLNVKFLGPITPVGGLLLIAAWTVLLIKILGKKAE